ncbi:MAG: hypothetical protein WCL00_13400, partial [Bacteroidota bacterium]
MIKPVNGLHIYLPVFAGILVLCFFILADIVYGQNHGTHPILIYSDTLLQPSSKIRIKKTHDFYDSIYQKFSRHRFTKMVYGLAFSSPAPYPIPDSMQRISGDAPFKQFSGKIIRNIRILVLAPFGSSISDTNAKNKTKVGGALNSAHMNTRKFMIRKNLLFHKGDKID